MSQMFRELLFDPYVQYDSDKPRLGSFCWAPVAYTHTTINVVRPNSNDPASPDHKNYHVQQITNGGVGKDGVPLGHRFPDKELSLGQGEDLFVLRGKIRPVVPVICPKVSHSQVKKDGGMTEKRIDYAYGCLPSYSLTDTSGHPQSNSVEFVENVQNLKYSVFCYLPKHPTFQQNRDTFLRMDRFIWIKPDLLQPMKVRLNKLGRGYVLSWLKWFSGQGPLPEELEDARELLLEELDDQRKQRDAAETQ